jgi:hypothetical protein
MPAFRGSKQIVTWQIKPDVIAMVKAIAQADGIPAQVAAEKLIVEGIETREKESK